jgi:ACDE family multidrug resistance protein
MSTATPIETAGRRKSGSMWVLYAGGFLGPFGGSMVTPMLPELADAFETTRSTVAGSITAYFIPFAGFMLVSGSLAERWGRERTVRWAYLLYALSSLGSAVAPNIEVFFFARSVQGLANAFTTPILIAMIADLAGPNERGRFLGRYIGLQAAGAAFAPLVGGLAASILWRWAFVVSAVVSLGLMVMRMPHGVDVVRAEQTGPKWARVHALANPRLLVASVVSFLLHSTFFATIVLTALIAEDKFGLGPQTRGLVVAASGGAGILLASRLGAMSDRFGVPRFGAVAALALALSTAALGLVPSVAGLLIAIIVAGGSAAGARIASSSLAVASTPENRSGATSIALSWQFLGGALSPILWIPVYESNMTKGLTAASSGAATASVILFVLAVRGRRRSG